jgi:hypothetical protein
MRPKDEAQPDEIDRLEQRLHALDRQWTRLLDAFQDALIDKDTLAVRKQQFDQERLILEQRRQLLQRQQRLFSAKQQMLDDFDAFAQQILYALHNPSPQLQQEVIRLLIDRIVVDPDTITIKHVVPTDDDCRLLPGRIET